MKFIDLYNRNKNTEVFKEKQRKFKAWARLAKNNPYQYKITFNPKDYCFNYEEKVWSEGGNIWINKDDSRYCGMYKKMSDFERC